MHRLKGFLLVISGFMIVITLFSLIMPSTVVVVRTETIPVAKTVILDLIKTPQQWENWYPPLMEKDVESNITNQFIKTEQDGKQWSIHFNEQYEHGVRTSFIRKGEQPVINDISVFEVDGIPQVEWKAIHQLRWYPWEKFGGIFLDDLSGPGYALALTKLKDYAQQADK